MCARARLDSLYLYTRTKTHTQEKERAFSLFYRHSLVSASMTRWADSIHTDGWRQCGWRSLLVPLSFGLYSLSHFFFMKKIYIYSAQFCLSSCSRLFFLHCCYHFPLFVRRPVAERNVKATLTHILYKQTLNGYRVLYNLFLVAIVEHNVWTGRRKKVRHRERERKGKREWFSSLIRKYGVIMRYSRKSSSRFVLPLLLIHRLYIYRSISIYARYALYWLLCVLFFLSLEPLGCKVSGKKSASNSILLTR